MYPVSASFCPVFRPRALVHGLHDAAAAAGDDHVSRLGKFLSEMARHVVDRFAGLCSCRAEDRDLSDGPIRSEYLRGKTHFLQG